MSTRPATLGRSKSCGIHFQCGFRHWGGGGCVFVGISMLSRTLRNDALLGVRTVPWITSLSIVLSKITP
ncbi:hypothetical protein A2U01_0094832 [Trifolium medium]|uniref:Uncharacterized protein n=1 Tax=Trifolium medium TaxID=97028 RepID=A0A392UL07_9FABA|nr:hypothetical protein [Trifolium medium]